MGIAVGKQGGIAVVGSNRDFVTPMPLNGKVIDAVEIGGLLREHMPSIVCVENAAANTRPRCEPCPACDYAPPTMGPGVMSKYFVGFGKILGAIEGQGIDLVTVTKRTWKKSVLTGTDKSKEAAVALVTKRFPWANLTPGRRRVEHVGMLNALCIAEYITRREATATLADLAEF